MNYLLIASSFVLSFTFVFLLIRYAEKLGFVDIPNARSVHKKPIPRGAGVGFVSAVMISTLLFDFTFFVEYYYIYLAIAVIFLVGLLDDKLDVSPKLKFVFIFIATFILYMNDIAIFSLGSYFGYEVPLPYLLVLPFTFLAVAGLTNAVNLVDGLDGLAGSIVFVMLGAFLAIGLLHGDAVMITLASTFMATIAAFLAFNWRPAKIFMGDSGSLTLGLVIALLSIKALAYVTPGAVLFIAALPLLDTFMVMTRRIQRGLSPFTADKNHLHHFLYKTKMDVMFTVKLMVSIQFAFSIIGYQLGQEENVLTLILFAVMFYLFLNFFDQRIQRRPKTKKEPTAVPAIRKHKKSNLATH